MATLHMFQAQVGMFNPLALMNQFVRIYYLQELHYRQVDFLESIPPFQCIDLGALAAQTVSARTPINNLELEDDEFGLFRWYCIDNAQIRFFHPRGVAKFELRNIQIPLDYKTMERDPNLVSTEFAVWEDRRPAIEAINGMDYALHAVRMIAMGYRFHTVQASNADIERIKSGDQSSTAVWASGRGQG